MIKTFSDASHNYIFQHTVTIMDYLECFQLYGWQVLSFTKCLKQRSKHYSTWQERSYLAVTNHNEPNNHVQ